jgi:alpha-ribazole phosphatase
MMANERWQMREVIEGATIVTVLRHGAVDGPAFVYRGRLDDPLSDLGWRQMEAVGAGLPALHVIATSPLRRCRDFAQHLADRHGLPLQVSAAFQEIDFGEWEGLTPEQVASRDPTRHRLFRAGIMAAPGGEALADLRHRVGIAWETWLADSTGGHRLLLTHAGVMRALLVDLLGLPAAHGYRIALPEAASFQVSLLAGEAPILLALNTSWGE